MLKLVYFLIAYISIVNAFDDLEFKEKYCYEDKDARTTDYYFPYGTNYIDSVGFICEKFVLKEDDLNSIFSRPFNISHAENIFFKNCEIEFFNGYLVTQFPNIKGLYLDNCKVGLKRPNLSSSLKPPKTFTRLGFHNCEITGNKESIAFELYTNLKDILIQNSTFESPYIDRKLFFGNSNLNNIIIDNTNINKFHEDFLLNIPNGFDIFTCTSSDLDEIDSILYRMRKDQNVYKTFSFHDNMIKRFPKRLWYNITFNHTTHIDLSRNKISEPILERIYFKSFYSLQLLDLSENTNITEIGYSAFKDTYLRTLNMSNVHLRILNDLGGVLNLMTIDFSHNDIVKINKETFKNLINLKYLDLKFNLINELDESVFKNLANLAELNLSYNKLIILPLTLFDDLEQLRILDLSYNNLKYLDGFEKLQKLQELRLQGNLLRMIPSGESLPSSLKILDIRSNVPYFIGRSTFSNVNELISLDMSFTNNSIISYVKNTYLYFDKYCLEDMKMLKTLKFENNEMSSMEEIYIPETIEELDLSFNNIEILTKKGFENLNNLKYLNLSYNRIHTIEAGALEKLSQLKYLDLTGNYV